MVVTTDATCTVNIKNEKQNEKKQTKKINQWLITIILSNIN